jgi:hypothetical protein
MVLERHLEGRVGVCVAHPLESCCRLINVVGIPVWVVDQSETTVGTLDLLSRSTLANLQGLVVVECWCGRHRANSHFRTVTGRKVGEKKDGRMESSSPMLKENVVEDKWLNWKGEIDFWEIESKVPFLGGRVCARPTFAWARDWPCACSLSISSILFCAFEPQKHMKQRMHF